jgi:N-acetylmuramidase
MMTLEEYADHGDIESAKSLVLTDFDYEDCANFLGVDIAAIKTVAAVESRGRGFFPDDTPKTLFEAHKFYKYTDGLYAVSEPDICSPNWNQSLYGKTWKAEKIRFNRAEALDQEAAMLSASWGKFQIMGFNFKAAGFNSVLDFVKAMFTNEGAHLAAFSRFIRANPHLHMALQEHDWRGFALYNGTGQVDKYTSLLINEFARQS